LTSRLCFGRATIFGFLDSLSLLLFRLVQGFDFAANALFLFYPLYEFLLGSYLYGFERGQPLRFFLGITPSFFINPLVFCFGMSPSFFEALTLGFSTLAYFSREPQALLFSLAA